jgi:hypothetical protein
MAENEGEFASLRETVDLLVGVGGELPANPRHGVLLARRLLENKVSAVAYLYELGPSPLRRTLPRGARPPWRARFGLRP